MGIRTELNLRLPNSPGALAGVLRTLADERVHIQAMTLGAMGQLRLVVDNPVRAAGALRGRHHGVTEREVLTVVAPPDVDVLPRVLSLLGDAGINVEYAYGGAGEARSTGTLVLGVDDAMRAAGASADEKRALFSGTSSRTAMIRDSASGEPQSTTFTSVRTTVLLGSSSRHAPTVYFASVSIGPITNR